VHLSLPKLVHNLEHVIISYIESKNIKDFIHLGAMSTAYAHTF
jgi:hypothetical protein